MQHLLTLGILVFSLSAFSQSNHERLANLTELNRIAFGSCNDQGDDQPLWDDLIRQKPDLWIWGGDNIYADWMQGGGIRQAYELQNKHPRYQQFKRQTPMIGTWDDHDYASDNANGHYAGKKESQKLHLDFLEVPEDSHLRNQEGIYASHEYGNDGRRIKIILLDNRYFKNLDPEYPLLGKVQWDWLEDELTNSDAKLHFIVTGLPVTSPLIPYTEEWAESKELNRMLDLLKRTQPKGVVFLTGDKHFSSIYRRWGQLEFMSSGMTHVAQQRTWFYLRQKYPMTYFGRSYGQIDIKWDAEIPTIRMSMRTVNGTDANTSGYKWLANKWQAVKVKESGN